MRELKTLPVDKPAQMGNTSYNTTPTIQESLTVENRISRLELIVGQIGEAVLATTETIDRLADRVDNFVIQVQNQGQQVQQQGYQLFALSDAVQTLAETQNESLKQLDQVTQTLQQLATAIEAGEH